MKITIIGTDYPLYEQYCPHWNGIKRGLERLNIEYQFISCRPQFEDSKFEQIKNFKPDLIVYGMLDMVKHFNDRMTIKVQNPQAKIVMWYGDLRNKDTGQVFADCSEVDAMFVSNDAQKSFYNEIWGIKEVYFLPLGAEPIEKPIFKQALSIPFLFIGGKITGKSFLGRAVEIGRYEKEGLKVVNSFEHDLRKKIFENMPALYSSSKVSLDVSHFTDIKAYTSIRYWEIPAFWGFALTKRFPDCEQFYSKDERVYFDTFEEAIDLKNYYLKNESERLKFVEKGHKRSFDHSYNKRFKRMFELLGINMV
jgi:spore maturation protein CgeB